MNSDAETPLAGWFVTQTLGYADWELGYSELWYAIRGAILARWTFNAHLPIGVETCPTDTLYTTQVQN